MAVKCSNLIYTPKTALSFSIAGGTRDLTPHTVDGKILSLEGPDGFIIHTGLTLEVKKTLYKINFIEGQEINGRIIYTLSTAKPTKASLFVTPMMGDKCEDFFWDRLFMNCFIATDTDYCCIALLFRWSGDPLFLKFEGELSKRKNFKRTYDPSTNTVMFVFDVEDRHAKDYDRFTRGKYSEISSGYKRHMLDFHGMKKDSELGQILFKAPERRDSLSALLGVKLDSSSELLSVINEDDETFDEDFYKCKKQLR